MLKTHRCVVLVCGVGFGSFWGADGLSGEGPTGSGLGRAYCGLGSKLVCRLTVSIMLLRNCDLM